LYNKLLVFKRDKAAPNLERLFFAELALFC
jgi:hypothetical protein